MEQWHRQRNLLTNCKVAGLIHTEKCHFPQEDSITLIPKRTMLSPYPRKSLHQSCHFSTALTPYSITSLLYWHPPLCFSIQHLRPDTSEWNSANQCSPWNVLSSLARKCQISHFMPLSALSRGNTSQNKTQMWWQERNLGRRPNFNY